MEVARSIAEMRAIVKDWRKADQRVSLVPTMGALHTGHISLVHLGQEKTEKSVVSIFVNPTQFAPHEDFNTYPRDEERDFSALRKAGVDLVFAPRLRKYTPTTITPKLRSKGSANYWKVNFGHSSSLALQPLSPNC